MAANKVISVVGFSACPYFQRAGSMAKGLAQEYHPNIAADVRAIDPRNSFLDWLSQFRPKFAGAENHNTCPFVYENKNYIGGCDGLFAHLKKNYPDSKTTKEFSKYYPSL
eukprot:TRINITY_DN2783_c0_g1_i3.p2 TRINITY_DN2783_c0_g1~~TRINITY_DN2783_c0_g1_i3.p2  ORF type:complete len:110 (+),score=15.11 TRINITY_DN2783_c0_g1_i3:132-461(+)